MNGSTGNTTEPGPIEAGFRAAHKARAARLGVLAKPEVFVPTSLVDDLREKLAGLKNQVCRLERKNTGLRALIDKLELKPDRPVKPKVQWIIRQRAQQFGITSSDVVGASRRAKIVEARQAAIHDVRQLRPELSYPVIGRMFGNRDHSTIIYSERQHQARIDDGTARLRPPVVMP